MCSTELKLEKSFFVKYTWTRMSDRLRDRAWMVHVRTEFLVKDVVEYMLLKENGLKLNGYTDVRRGQLKDVSNEVACIQEEDFLEARKEIVTCCERMKTQYGQELEEMCKKLDVNDEQLHTNFIEILTAIWEEKSARNWGRFISMLVAAYYVSDKLYKDGAKDKIDSVIGWLTKYLKMNAVTWIEDRGGYVRVFLYVHCWRVCVVTHDLKGRICIALEELPSSLHRK